MNNKNPLKTLCDLKWNYPIFNMSRGEFRSCCRTPAKVITKEDIDNNGVNAFLNSTSEKESRFALLTGQRHADCRSCWTLEDAGMKSPRHSAGQFWNHLIRSGIVDKGNAYTDSALLSTIDNLDFSNPILESKTPYMLEINLGNLCDMKCMYCNHHYSSQWGTELIKWGDITPDRMEKEFPKAPAKFDETFWGWFNSVGRLSLNRIGIIGGEPLITPEFYVLLDKLIASITEVSHLRGKSMNLWIVTNLNTPPAYLEKFLNYLPKLTELFNVSIYASMESTGLKAEYIRYGVNWDRFVSNVDSILTIQQQQNIDFVFSFMPSVNILSVAGTIDFLRYVEGVSRRYNIPVGITQNIVSLPDWQSPLLLTPDFATYLDAASEYIASVSDLKQVTDPLATWSAYGGFLNNLANSIRNNNTSSAELRRKFSSWFRTYDQRRMLSLLEIFPEYSEFIALCDN